MFGPCRQSPMAGEQLRGSTAVHAFYMLDSFRGDFKSVTDLHISDRVLLINSILTGTYVPPALRHCSTFTCSGSKAEGSVCSTLSDIYAL